MEVTGSVVKKFGRGFVFLLIVERIEVKVKVGRSIGRELTLDACNSWMRSRACSVLFSYFGTGRPNSSKKSCISVGVPPYTFWPKARMIRRLKSPMMR